MKSNVQLFSNIDTDTLIHIWQHVINSFQVNRLTFISLTFILNMLKFVVNIHITMHYTQHNQTNYKDHKIKATQNHH